jgi:hypothetical protein
MAFLLQKRPDQHAQEDDAEQAQREDPVVLYPAQVSEDVLDHSSNGFG